MSSKSLCRALSIALFLLLFFSTASTAQEGERAFRDNELQDRYIDTLIEDQIPVVISLANFVEVEGLVLAHDKSVVLLRNLRWRSRQRLIYKSTIAVIAPIPAVSNVLSDF
jgi:RNA chaperone Hfq